MSDKELEEALKHDAAQAPIKPTVGGGSLFRDDAFPKGVDDVTPVEVPRKPEHAADCPALNGFACTCGGDHREPTE